MTIMIALKWKFDCHLYYELTNWNIFFLLLTLYTNIHAMMSLFYTFLNKAHRCQLIWLME